MASVSELAVPVISALLLLTAALEVDIRCIGGKTMWSIEEPNSSLSRGQL